MSRPQVGRPTRVLHGWLRELIALIASLMTPRLLSAVGPGEPSSPPLIGGRARGSLSGCRMFSKFWLSPGKGAVREQPFRPVPHPITIPMCWKSGIPPATSQCQSFHGERTPSNLEVGYAPGATGRTWRLRENPKWVGQAQNILDSPIAVQHVHIATVLGQGCC